MLHARKTIVMSNSIVEPVKAPSGQLSDGTQYHQLLPVRCFFSLPDLFLVGGIVYRCVGSSVFGRDLIIVEARDGQHLRYLEPQCLVQPLNVSNDAG